VAYFKYFLNNFNESKFYSRRNQKKIEIREFLISFGTEFFVFNFPFQNIKSNVCRTIILPFVLYGCETWSLTFREERRVSENRVLRRISGPKRDEVTSEWRKSHEELDDLYCSPNIILVIKWRRMRWAGHEARMGEGRCISGFGGKT